MRMMISFLTIRKKLLLLEVPFNVNLTHTSIISHRELLCKVTQDDEVIVDRNSDTHSERLAYSPNTNNDHILREIL